ncbi:MAG: tRNA 4-thiouridine(8) synthase ThiI [Thermodesulfobacteriota bacterium]
MTKGYGIFSGGLDSLLSTLVLQDQGIEVVLLTFTTPFFGAERARVSGCSIGLVPRVLDLTEPHLEMMKKPKHGFGRFMNPCIDCHALMFKTAGGIMRAEGGDFLFSGEVLGQRPKSQNRRALDIVARESGWPGFILRPLSALALPPTAMEQSGLVDRTRLKGFYGRTRKPQMALASQYGLKDYPSPAGGCLLTDPVFSRRLAELREHVSAPTGPDLELLKVGRHFRLPGGGKVVVGRNQAENEVIETLGRPQDLVLKVAGIPGPTVILCGGSERTSSEDVELAAAMTASYSDAAGDRSCPVRLLGGSRERLLETPVRPKSEFAGLMI